MQHAQGERRFWASKNCLTRQFWIEKAAAAFGSLKKMERNISADKLSSPLYMISPFTLALMVGVAFLRMQWSTAHLIQECVHL